MADLQDISTSMTEISLKRNNICDLPPFTGGRSTGFSKPKTKGYFHFLKLILFINTNSQEF